MSDTTQNANCPTPSQQTPDCEAPVMPKAQIMYGDVVYYLTIVSAMLCAIGPMVAMMNVDNNVLDPQYLFGAIWAGKDVAGVWSVTGNTFPGGHFWIDNLFTGDGLTQLGLVIGGSCAGPALAVSAWYYMTDKTKKQPLWAALALWTVFLVFVSAVGIIDAGH